MSPGEKAKPLRRRTRRRSRRAPGPPQHPPGDTGDMPNTANSVTPETTAPSPGTVPAQPRKPRPRKTTKNRLRTVHEVSAGGLVIHGIDGPRETQLAAIIGRLDRRGRMLWSLPKGHLEPGETADQTAIREVAEETGIRGEILAALGDIDYWFVTEGRRVHKKVHHYLLRFSSGQLCDEDREVSAVAWIPLMELPRRLAYADERQLVDVAADLIGLFQSGGPAALPPLPQMSPQRRTQTHSHTRRGRPKRPSRRRAGRPGPHTTNDGPQT